MQVRHGDDFQSSTADLLVEAEEGRVERSLDGRGKDEGDGAERGEVLLESAALFFARVCQLGVEQGVAFGRDVVEALSVAD